MKTVFAKSEVHSSPSATASLIKPSPVEIYTQIDNASIDSRYRNSTEIDQLLDTALNTNGTVSPNIIQDTKERKKYQQEIIEIHI